MMKFQQRHALWGLAALVGALCLLALWPSAIHARQIPDPTATPDADGVIYAEVRVDDSLWAIANRSRISLETLLALNNMTASSLIRVGDLLIIGLETPPATATLEASLTPTLAPPTPTWTPSPPPPTAVCLLAYVDQNQNGVHDPGEKLRPAVAFTIYNESVVAANYVTTGVSEPHCLSLAPGAYQITRSAARNEFLTTDGNVAVVLRQGDVVNLAFGGFVGPTATPSATSLPVTATQTLPAAAIGAELVVTDTPGLAAVGNNNRDGENGRFPLWPVALLLFFFVLIGVGVIFLSVRAR